MKKEGKMKKTLLFAILLIYSMNFLKGQNPSITCNINFEDNPCMEASFYNITIPGYNNLWQVCTPNNTVFDSAFSFPKAILTDSAGPYPVNNISSFIVKFIPLNDGGCWPVIGAEYKFDSDTLKDFGRVEFSLDHGITWLNALSDTIIPDGEWLTPKPVLTGRIHQWTNFLAFIPNYNFSLNDTIYYRFTFISDSIQTNQEGWMLDDLYLVDHIEDVPEIQNSTEINIYPNPAINMITISNDGFTGDMVVSIYNFQGQLRLQKTINRNQENLNISSLCKGIYMVRVQSRNNYIARIMIKDE